nr:MULTISPECIES: hypothetical protein [unclassified Caballeronia]
MKTRAKKTVIGTIKCHCCERDIPAKENEHGTLDVSCQWCEMPVYAKKGTEAHKRLSARVVRFPVPHDATPASVPEPFVPPSQEKPAARAARGVFDVFGS